MRNRGCVGGAAVAGAMLFSLGCLGSQQVDESIAVESLPIIGGVLDSGDPAVVMTTTYDGLCTGTLISDTVVLTAAHCIKGGIDAGQTGGRVYFGSGGSEDWIATRNITDLFAHRFYEGGLSSGYDIGLIRLASPAPVDITPLPLNPYALDESYIGAQIRTVGFGANYSDPDGQNQSGFGTKRQVQHAILDVNSERIVTGDSAVNTCQGDSGGPTFMRINDVEYIIAVTSFGAQGCRGESEQTRVDVFLDEFLFEVIAAWSGPCQGGDFQCVTEGCGDFPDPDCEPCGVDGQCSPGCDRKDLDCPASGLLGELCNDREGCESLTCVESDDDPRVKYCSMPCDPNDSTSCPAPITACETRAEGSVCTYPGITPSAQGSPCVTGTDCRSGVCDDKHLICIEQCGDGFAACAEPYSCVSIGGGAKACTFPRDDGGCSAGSQRPLGSGLALVLLVGAALLLARKRRSGLFKTR